MSKWCRRPLRRLAQWLTRNRGKVAWTFFFTTMVLVVVVAFQVWMLHSRGWRIALGTVPDYLAAAGTVATAFGAVAAFRTLKVASRQWELAEKERTSLESQRQAADKERQALAELRERERRDHVISQARLIIVEPVRLHLPDGRPYPRKHFVIHNHSAQPIFDLKIERQCGYTPIKQLLPGVDPLDFSAHDHSPFYRQWPEDIDALPPDATTNQLFPDGPKKDTPLTDNIRFTFMDAHGARWRRVGNQQPVQILDDPV